MKKTSKIIGIVIVALFLTKIMIAQGPGRHGDPAAHLEKRLEHLTEKLTLSEAQAVEVKAIFEKYAPKMQALHDEVDSREEMKTAMKAMHAEVSKDMKTVLSAEQYEQWKEMKPRRPRGRRGAGDKKMNKALHAAIKQYYDANIHPVLKAQRAKLEPKISADDQALLAELRPKFEKRRTAMKQRMQKVHEEGSKAERRDMRKEMKAAFRADREQIGALVKKYEEDINPLLEELQPQMDTWHEDIQKIGEEYMGGETPERPPFGMLKMIKQRHLPGHFLLIDPNAVETIGTTSASLIQAISVFPNPAAGTSQLTYTLLEDSRVIIELRNREGTVLKRLQNAELMAGEQSQEVDFSSLPVGVYYLTIQDEKRQTVSQKVVVGR